MKHFLLFAVIFLSGFSVSADANAQVSRVSCVNYYGAAAYSGPSPATITSCRNHALAIFGTIGGYQDVGTGNAPNGASSIRFWKNATPFSVGNPVIEAQFSWGPYTCPVGTEFDAAIRDCVIIPEPVDPCPPGQVTGPSGICTTDPDPDETPCKNVLGYVNGVEVCQDEKDECEAQGGSYGIIMDEVGCLIGEEDPEKECESETFIFGNEYGGYVCVHPDETNPNDDTPDPAVECPAGYTLSGNSCVTTNADPGGDDDDDGVPNADDDDRDGDGVDNARDPDRGVGQCDPTSVAYAECVGQMTQVSNTAAADIRSAVNRGGASALDGVVAGAKSAIGSGNAGMGQPTDVVEELTGFSGFNPGSCSDIAFDVFAHPMAIECSETQRLRDVLSWVFAFLALVYIVNLALLRSA